MNKKIMILSNDSGGLVSFRKELIEELLKRNIVVSIMTPFTFRVDELKSMDIKIFKSSLNRRGVNPIKDFRLIIQYWNVFRKERPNTIITYTIKPNIYGGIVCRLLKIPYVSNITGLGTAFQKQGFLKKIVTFLYKLGLKKADVVFFENVENLNIFLDYNIIKKEQSYLLNGAGVNLKKYQSAEYPKMNDVTKFLFIGRVMQEKGINELLKAMNRLNNERAHCILDILGDYEEDFSTIIKEYEKCGWLFYHGHIEDVRPFIERCHCFVLPSWHEGMANTNLECAAMGRPIITSNIHGCKEAVIENVSGYLCEKQNEDSLYQMMKKFMTLSYDERKAMGIAGREHMVEMFDKRKVIEETINKLSL